MSAARVFTLLGAVVEDAWKERTSADVAAHRALRDRMGVLDLKRNRLVDVYLDRGIDQATFEGQSARLDHEQTDLRERIEAARPVEVDLASTITFATTLLDDLPDVEPPRRPAEAPLRQRQLPNRTRLSGRIYWNHPNALVDDPFQGRSSSTRGFGTPNGIRTRVTCVKGRRPRPLDDGGLSSVSGPEHGSRGLLEGPKG